MSARQCLHCSIKMEGNTQQLGNGLDQAIYLNGTHHQSPDTRSDMRPSNVKSETPPFHAVSFNNNAVQINTSSSENTQEDTQWTDNMRPIKSRLSESRDSSANTSISSFNSGRVLTAREYISSLVTLPKGPADSFASEQSEDSSRLSSFSSKATTPVDIDGSKSQNHGEAIRKPSDSFTQHVDRLDFVIRPKSSIPPDLPTQQYASECITAAESSRLNPYALHGEEYLLLRHHLSHTQVTTYLNIRNGILRLWLRHPWKRVTRQEAVGCANARWFDAANVCYDWLVRRGYINFGCLELSSDVFDPTRPGRAGKAKTITVIGAGISGLSCARQLEGLFKQYAEYFRANGEEPPRVVLVEGRSRVGGRVYSREFKTRPAECMPGFEGKRCTAEMGGMIITGFDRGNPMNVLVRGQLCLPYHALTAETTIYDSDGNPVDAERDQLIEKLYNDCLDRVSEYKFKQLPTKLIEGNRDLLGEGRDSHGDGSKTIIEAEKAAAELPNAPSVSQQSVTEAVDMVPVSSDKLTGRVHTEPGVPGSMKAAEKAKKMGWNLKPNALETENLDLSNEAARQESTLGSVLDYAISQYKNLVDLNALDHRLINWHIANLEYSNATNLHNLSLSLWDIDAGNEWDGRHTMVVGGYQSVARGLLHSPAPLDIRTKCPVKTIRYRNSSFPGPATIECEDGTTIDSDAIVCTVPLGVLKHGNVKFDPPLPPWKVEAIDRLGFGILNKVVLVYEKIFWESDRHIFGILKDAPDPESILQGDYGANRGRFFQWFNVTNTTGLPCLIALMAGDAGFETEHSTNEALISEATETLRSVFGEEVPYPVEAVVTRWGSDKFARGSYSSAAPGMRPDDYESMARPLGNLFFAGEHTIGTHPATVHGAYLSGLRAASEIIDNLLGPIEVPTPLILPRDSLLVHKRKEAAKDPRQARLDAYEAAAWNHVKKQLGDRPSRPAKVTGNAYLLYSRAKFEEARTRCEESRKSGKAKAVPNEVRVMTSRMWKAATPEERKPFEEQAVEQKRAYAEAMQEYIHLSEKWDLDAIAARAAFETENPLDEGDKLHSSQLTPRNRRVRNISYAEDRDSDLSL